MSEVHFVDFVIPSCHINEGRSVNMQKSKKIYSPIQCLSSKLLSGITAEITKWSVFVVTAQQNSKVDQCRLNTKVN